MALCADRRRSALIPNTEENDPTVASRGPDDAGYADAALSHAMSPIAIRAGRLRAQTRERTAAPARSWSDVTAEYPSYRPRRASQDATPAHIIKALSYAIICRRDARGADDGALATDGQARVSRRSDYAMVIVS